MHARRLALPWMAAPAFALALSACTPQPGGPSASNRHPTYSVDLAGKAASCTAPEVQLTQGQAATGTISTGGGGWCGIPVTLNGDALTAGLLTQAPRAGQVYVHTVGDVTRVDYTPTGAATADAFAVQFLPGDETMRVTVSGATPAAVRK